jgi:hypothetical protein
MPVQSLKRGAIPSPRSALAAATPFAPLAGAPPQFLLKPQKLSFWGNDVHGDCVTAEEAFAKACNNPEIFIPDADVMAWATRHGVLEGAYLNEVLGWMQTDGFSEGSNVYDDGQHFSVNWTNAAALQGAISQGPVKIGVAAQQLENAWHTTDGRSGWVATGFHADGNEDHCVSLCGYGPLAWLAQQLGGRLPAGIDGSKPGYALFTWNSIGIIDVPSMLAVTHEAWLRQPTTVTVSHAGFSYLQVKSSGQYLNILAASNANGAEACQGTNKSTDNFLWRVVPAADGYCYLQVRSSGQYLNIFNGSKANGAMACQGVNKSTDNFLWKIIPAADGYVHIQVKSSGQYLNILNASNANGALACQGLNDATPNFLWKVIAA